MSDKHLPDMHVTVHIHFARDEEIKYLVAGVATLLNLGDSTMTSISEFAAKQSAFNDRIDTAVDGLKGDIADLNAQIQKLQATPGAITPEDQALLDGITARGEALAGKLEALDQLTPPSVPPG